MLLIGKKYKEEKLKYYQLQDGICPLCKLELNPDVYSNHLDHDHELHNHNAGRVRGLLCNLCNSAEGQIKHKFNRSGLKYKADMIHWMKSLVEYYENDITTNAIHPKYITDKVKWFKSLNKDQMQDEITKMGLNISIDLKKDEIVKQYRTELRKVMK